jgi:TonB family protein
MRLVALLLLLACTGGRAETDLEAAGMAAYTETSRDIYLAALMMPAGATLENVYLAPGPKAMEYRITTRRISTRGFSGTLLLQSELGSGKRAPEQVIKVLDELKSSLEGALVRGDHFVIALSADDATTFYLNETELLNTDDGSVFDFFFAGWVGESSSALLRDSLLSGKLNPALKARFEALQPGPDRVAEIAAWGAEPTQSAQENSASAQVAAVAAAETTANDSTLVTAATTTAATETKAGNADSAVTEKEPETTVAAAPIAVAAAIAESPEAPTQTKTATAPKANPGPEKAKPIAAPVEIAAGPAPVKELMAAAASTTATPGPADESNASQSDDEYRRNLNGYLTDIMKKVFGNVNYPRRAIKKQRQGTVELLAHLDESGKLIEVTLDNSSGYTILDNAARKAVRKAAPFPELPPEVKEEFMADDGESYVVMIPVTFQLHN